MNPQEREAVNYLDVEETDEQDFFQFADLNLTDEQLAGVKGGPGSGWCTSCAIIYSNHNQTTAEDDEVDAELLADLLVEDAVQVKGGPGGGFGCTWCGLQGNHNETTAEDQIEAGEDFFQFADLELTDEQLTEVKGGPGGCSWCGYLGNHNETTISDEVEEAEEDFFQFADLNLTDEQLAEVKGGPGAGFGCTWCGVNGGNHNETTATDDEEAEAETLNLDDLIVSAAQDDAITGGRCPLCGPTFNHNETTAEDDNEAEDFFQFADLELADEQLAEIKGGPGGGCTWCGLSGNHNETTAEDDKVEVQQLHDLAVNEEQQAEVTGGGGITKFGSKRLVLQGDGI